MAQAIEYTSALDYTARTIYVFVKASAMQTGKGVQDDRNASIERAKKLVPFMDWNT